MHTYFFSFEMWFWLDMVSAPKVSVIFGGMKTKNLASVMNYT